MHNGNNYSSRTHSDERVTFQALRHDPTRSPWYERSRTFDPKVAPWINQQPVAYVEGMNAYVAFGDNPINAVNPMGG